MKKSWKQMLPTCPKHCIHCQVCIARYALPDMHCQVCIARCALPVQQTCFLFAEVDASSARSLYPDINLLGCAGRPCANTGHDAADVMAARISSTEHSVWRGSMHSNDLMQGVG